MSHIAHALAEEFADKAETIHRLKVENAHFRHLLELNETLYNDLQRMQSNEAPAADEEIRSREKRRLVLLDEIKAMIDAA